LALFQSDSGEKWINKSGRAYKLLWKFIFFAKKNPGCSWGTRNTASWARPGIQVALYSL